MNTPYQDQNNEIEYINQFLNQHRVTVDENNRIHIECLCDGTLLFLAQMVSVLEAIGCTEIETSGEIVTDGIHPNKPWCNYLYKASGILPDGIKLVKKGDVEDV